MASGATLVTWTAEGARLGSGTPGLLDVRNFHPVVALSSGDEVSFGAILPRNYAGGGITVYLHSALASATSGNVKYETYFERVGDGSQDIDSDGYASANNTGDVAVPATSGHIDIISVAHTDGAQIDSVAVGEYFRLKVKRVAASSSDASGDAQLVAIELKET